KGKKKDTIKTLTNGNTHQGGAGTYEDGACSEGTAGMGRNRRRHRCRSEVRAAPGRYRIRLRKSCHPSAERTVKVRHRRRCDRIDRVAPGWRRGLIPACFVTDGAVSTGGSPSWVVLLSVRDPHRSAAARRKPWSGLRRAATLSTRNSL